jgi:hypothetical protein
MRILAPVAALLFLSPLALANVALAEDGEETTDTAEPEADDSAATEAGDEPSATKAEPTEEPAEAAPEEAAPEEAAPEEAAPEEAAPEEAASEEAAPEEAATEEAAPEEVVEEAAEATPPVEPITEPEAAPTDDGVPTLAGRAVGHVAEGIEIEATARETRRDGDNCTFDDLKGDFTLTLPCDLLGDHTGNSQPHKRIWLGAPEGQLNMIEVPDPYRTVELDVVMGNLGRFWTSMKTPEPAHETTLGGIEARVVTERKIRTLTRHWIFKIDGRNVTAKLVAYEGTHAARTAWLARASEAFEAGIKFGE